MNRDFRHHLAAFAIALSCIAGCRRDREAPKTAGDSDREWEIRRPEPPTARSTERKLPVTAQPALVKQGPPPLVYMIETPMTVSVVDLKTNQRLARAAVPARTIVRVEARNGVIFGTEPVAPGPLAPQHEFGIFLEASDTNVIRSETVSPSRPD